jgi:hypothetical protein
VIEGQRDEDDNGDGQPRRAGGAEDGDERDTEEEQAESRPRQAGVQRLKVRDGGLAGAEALAVNPDYGLTLPSAL